MYIAMNRFKIKKGSEETFEEVWRTRESRLKELPGFVDFHLLRCNTGSEEDDVTLYASHAIWRSKEDFTGWTKSEQFRDAHKNAGERRALFAGPPHFEGFEVIMGQE